jgi:G:T/U-mismatch repair DNA glycosylase
MKFVHPIKKKYPKFYPVADENSKILILGSFPSEDWEAGGFYYGSRRNRFWHLIVRLFDKQFRDSSSVCYSEIEKDSKIDAFVSAMAISFTLIVSQLSTMDFSADAG